MKEVTFVRVSADKVVNISQVAGVYVNPYGTVSGHLQGSTERFSVEESYADYFLSLVDTRLKEYHRKKVKQRKDREAEEHMRRVRGY